MRVSPIALSILLFPQAVSARPTIHPFSAELLARYAPALEHAEIAVVELDPQDHAIQTTLIGYTSAPPEMVHDLVAQPENYPNFIRNLTRSTVERRADGTLINHWKISYRIASAEGTDEIRLEPGATGAIVSLPIDKGKEGISREEFLPAPGGGTVFVSYGCYDSIEGIPLLSSLLKRNPVWEAGLNLAGALTVMRSVLGEANRRAAAKGIHPAQPSGDGPAFTELLDRGTVAVVRSGTHGELLDVSVVDRVPAPLPVILDYLRAPEKWPGQIASVKRVSIKHRDQSGLEYELAMSGVLTDIVTTYRMSYVPNGIDTLGIDGELKEMRNRWDLSPATDGSTIVVWRGNLHLGANNSLLRSMFKLEPSFEHAANVSAGLVSLRSVARHFGTIERKR